MPSHQISALVSGANSGIGREVARQLAADGHTVHVGSRDTARGREAVRDIGGDSHLQVLDVVDADSIAAAAASIDRLDVLVNNAGPRSPTSVPLTHGHLCRDPRARLGGFSGRVGSDRR